MEMISIIRPLTINLLIINRTVSGLNGVQVPLDSAVCNSLAVMEPLRSLSNLYHN